MTKPTQRLNSATIAVSRFRVANGMSEQVSIAFAERARLVDRVAGFLGLETYTDKKDADVFYLVTRWTDERSFRVWHDSAAHHSSHSFMPKGLRLDPTFTQLTVMDRLEAAQVHEPETLVEDASLLVADFLRDAAATVFAAATHEGVLWSCNEALLSLLGETREFLLGKSLWDYLPEPSATDLRALVAARERRSRALSLRLRGPCAERTLRCRVDVHATHFVLIGEPDLTVEVSLDQRLFEMNNELAVAARELTRKTRDLEAAKLQIEEQARRDVLTGLYNRRHLIEVMKPEIERAKRGLQSLSVVMFDLDHFKRINDNHGHLIGDAVLRATGAFVLKSLRPYDLAARYGGEEFIVLLPSTSLDNARIVAERVRTGLERLEVAGYEHAVTASFGAAQWELGETAEAWIDRADRALYEAKHAGRNRVMVATPKGAST